MPCTRDQATQLLVCTLVYRPLQPAHPAPLTVMEAVFVSKARGGYVGGRWLRRFVVAALLLAWWHQIARVSPFVYDHQRTSVGITRGVGCVRKCRHKH